MIPGALDAGELWVMATAVVCAVACALPGCYLVLRRMSLLGDAISHAVLPGLAVAFVLTGTREVIWMLVGALGAGLLTSLLTTALHRWGRVPEDAAMGVVFSLFFAVGVIIVNAVARQVDLDPRCVLYGLIEFVSLDTVSVAGIQVPRSFVWLAILLGANVLCIVVFYKELKLVSFDPALATAMGFSAAGVHYGLMTQVAATTVVSFESVGSILVVAMLIAPGATAHLLTDRLGRMLGLAALLAASAGVIGYLLALRWNTSVAGMMAVVSGVEFAAAVLLAPRYGFLSKMLHQAVLAARIRRQDILGMLYRWHERSTRDARPLGYAEVRAAIGGSWLTRLALASLLRRGLVVRHGGGALMLSPAGRAAAQSLVRSHRLWESYLARHLGLPPDHLHEASERMEHFITPSLQARLGEELPIGADPHGRPIPPPIEKGDSGAVA